MPPGAIELHQAMRAWCYAAADFGNMLARSFKVDRRHDDACTHAACRTDGVGAALVLPYANATSMNLHLAEISRRVAAGADAGITLDGAGWHEPGDKLNVPANISLLALPPYSPELNPTENIWQYLRQNQLANRIFENYDAIVEACCEAWNHLVAQPERITSIATRAWAQKVSV